MSKITANAASKFVTAYANGTKSSVAMVSECVVLLSAGLDTKAAIALVRGDAEKRAVITADTIKKFEILVSQRLFAASLVITLGTDAATDEIAIKSALKVASGALPRAAAKAVAEAHKGTNDAPAFAAGITAALAKGKAPAAPKVESPSGDSKLNAADNAAAGLQSAVIPAERVLSVKEALSALDSALGRELAMATPAERLAMLAAVTKVVNRGKAFASSLSTPALKTA